MNLATISATSATLAGSLVLRPGQGGAAIGSSRVPLAAALLRGRPAGDAALILPRLYALCGQAHRAAAELAVATALAGGTPGPAALAPVPAALAAETLREHVRRLLIDWPRLLGQSNDDAVAVLRACPLFSQSARAHNGENRAAAREWIARALLGEPLAPWLASWRADRAMCLRRWSRRSRTLPARLMRAVEDDASALAPVWPPLLAHANEAGMRTLAAQVGADGAFDPGAGMAPETGCWSRLGGCLGGMAPASAWLRMGARVAEVCALVEHDGEDAHGATLACGALALGPGEALAWTEMARGVLCHRVRLELGGVQPIIGDYRVMAPTEWNFHPRGAVASALAAMPRGGNAAMRGATARRIGVLAAAFDPCVQFEIEFAHA